MPVPIPAFSDNYIWAIKDTDAQVFDCVDPGEAKPVLDFANQQNLQLRSILLTHHHHDHIGGVEQLIQHFPQCIVYGPVDPRIKSINNPVEADQTITVGANSYTILSNPGHTSTHISYYNPRQGWLFCGDTLFSAGCGRVFDGTIEELHQSLLLFKKLPPATNIFCAHEYTRQNLKFAQSVEPHNVVIKDYIQTLESSSSLCSLPSLLSFELLINPFLRTDIKEVINYATNHGSASTTSLDIFKVLRDQKNNF